MKETEYPVSTGADHKSVFISHVASSLNGKGGGPMGFYTVSFRKSLSAQWEEVIRFATLDNGGSPPRFTQYDAVTGTIYYEKDAVSLPKKWTSYTDAELMSLRKKKPKKIKIQSEKESAKEEGTVESMPQKMQRRVLEFMRRLTFRKRKN